MKRGGANQNKRVNQAIQRVQNRGAGQWHDPVPSAVSFFPDQVPPVQEPQREGGAEPQADALMENLELRNSGKPKLSRTERYKNTLR